MHLAFASPYLLGFLAVLPVLWWLLRLTPPSPRKTIFPALALLRGLVAPEQTPARTPWWLLLLRLTIAALVILACAGPLIDPPPVTGGKGALLIAVDNDWAAARAWETRQNTLHDLIRQAMREDRAVILFPTAPPANGEALQVIGPVAAKAAVADRITPQPWPSDWRQAAVLMQGFDRTMVADAVWLSSGLGGTDAKTFYEILQRTGGARAISDPETPVYLLTPPQSDGEALSIAVFRGVTDDAATLSVAALAQDGHTLAHFPLHFPPGAPRAVATIDMPMEARNMVARIEIEGRPSAAATVLLDANWQRRSVGVAGDRQELAQHSLLNGLFYIDRALQPSADVHVDSLAALLKQNMAALMVTDTTVLDDDQIPALEEWIGRGGIFVRFAGNRLAAALNPKEINLLPVTLRTGDRAMGGALSWATPQKLHDFPIKSPFHGFAVPSDVTVSRQLLAEPASELADRTWAALEDGTPLVTAKPIGRGLSILFHIPARSDWSNLPLSGLFVEMLHRITDLSHGVPAETNFMSLPPLRMIDAFGAERKPEAAALPMTGEDFGHTAPGPHHPPGLYGSDAFSRAFNLGDGLGQPEALKDVSIEPYKRKDRGIDLQSYLLAAAFALLLGDFLISLWLRGLLAWRREGGVMRNSLAIGFAFLIFAAGHAHATDAKTAVDLTAKTYLAYVKTGDRETDRISESGLGGLARILQRRTSIDRIAVIGVDPDTDDLAFFPLIYWPIVTGEAPRTPQGAARVNDYLHHGGMILFDATIGENPPPALTRRILAGIEIPPLAPLPQEHVLKRSFYLLDDTPGRYAGNGLWLEPEDASSYDGVATVLSGNNGWAAAWAMDAEGKPLFPCTPGGEAQRERAYRFGVNLVMYALTGNYKSDQMHTQALLERMGK